MAFMHESSVISIIPVCLYVHMSHIVYACTSICCCSSDQPNIHISSPVTNRCEE